MVAVRRGFVRHRLLPCSRRRLYRDLIILRSSLHAQHQDRSEEHTSELQSLMRISYAVFCLKKKKINSKEQTINNNRTYKTRNNVSHSKQNKKQKRIQEEH